MTECSSYFRPPEWYRPQFFQRPWWAFCFFQLYRASSSDYSPRVTPCPNASEGEILHSLRRHTGNILWVILWVTCVYSGDPGTKTWLFRSYSGIYPYTQYTRSHTPPRMYEVRTRYSWQRGYGKRRALRQRKRSRRALPNAAIFVCILKEYLGETRP